MHLVFSNNKDISEIGRSYLEKVLIRSKCAV